MSLSPKSPHCLLGVDLHHYNEVVGGYIGFTSSVRPSVRPSIRPAFHVRYVAPTVLGGSFSYLYINKSKMVKLYGAISRH